MGFRASDFGKVEASVVFGFRVWEPSSEMQEQAGSEDFRLWDLVERVSELQESNPKP